jgi:hypothetical protein
MNEGIKTAYAKVALKGKEGKPIALFLAKAKFVVNLLRLHGCRIDESEGEGKRGTQVLGYSRHTSTWPST